MNLQLLFEQSFAVQLHVYAALFAFFLGLFVFWRKKGTSMHKNLGKVWVVLMFVTAFSSLFINQIRLVGPFSPIHLISVATIILLYVGIRQAQRRDIEKHRSTMKGTFIGGLVIAGGFTFMPDRLMYRITIEPVLVWFFPENTQGFNFGSDGLAIGLAFGGLSIALLIVNRKAILAHIPGFARK